MHGTIVILATPIGNLADMTDRAKQVLATADIVAAEDTRTTLKLARHLGLNISGRLVAHHEHNEAQSAAELVSLAQQGATIAVVTDAGMPVISDPGYRLVVAAIEAGVPVTCAPGASAVTTALAVSGLPSDRFAFEGFVPRKAGEKQRLFETLAQEPRTLIFYESPHRLADTLKVMAQNMGQQRAGCVARELTKLHEEIVRAPLGELADWAEDRDVKGEIVVLVGPYEQPELSFDQQLAQVQQLVDSGMRLKAATKQVAEETGTSARDLYNALLK